MPETTLSTFTSHDLLLVLKLIKSSPLNIETSNINFSVGVHNIYKKQWNGVRQGGFSPRPNFMGWLSDLDKNDSRPIL